MSKLHGSNDHKFFANNTVKKAHYEALLKPCSIEGDGIYKEFSSYEKARGFICLYREVKTNATGIATAIKTGKPYKGFIIKALDDKDKVV